MSSEEDNTEEMFPDDEFTGNVTAPTDEEETNTERMEDSVAGPSRQGKRAAGDRGDSPDEQVGGWQVANIDEGDNDAAYIHVIVKAMNSVEQTIEFKMKKKSHFQKLMKQFCDRFRIDRNTARFLYDGNPISVTSTPISLKMENMDVIEVLCKQDGGNNKFK